MLEDLGFYVVDNLPTSLLPTIVDLASQPGGIERLALVSGRRHDELLPHVARMRADGHRVTIVYLDASTPVLVQRYDATRRKHPLSDDAGGLLEAIELERTMLNPLKEHADLVIDSSELNVHQLKERLVSVFEQRGLDPAPDRGRELRLQERAPARRRHRDGRALPAQPALGRSAAAADRTRPARCATTCSSGR